MNALFIRTVLFLTIFFSAIAGAGPVKTITPKANRPASRPKIQVVDQNVICEEDGSVQIKLEAQGPNDVNLSYGIGFQPSHGTLSKVERDALTYIYTPNPDFFGRDRFRFSAYSREAHIGDTYGDISITVTPLPDKPIAQNIEVLTVENNPVEIDLLAYDPDGDVLKYNIREKPVNGTINLVDADNNIYLYTPNSNYNGNDKFRFDANDGNFISNIADVNITIMPESENFFKMNPSRVYSKKAGEPLKVEKPVDLVFDQKGNLYILSAPDNSQSKIFICDGNLGIKSSYDVNAKSPRGITVSDDNCIYVADTGNNRILRYNIDGSIDIKFGKNGSIGQAGDANGQFNKPRAVGIDWHKNLYVTDSGNNRVEVFDNSGKFKSAWRQITAYDAKSKQTSGGRSEYYKGYLEEISSQPRRITFFGQIRTNDRVPLKNPTGFYIFGDNELFLADTDNHKIKRLSTSGYLYAAAGHKGSEQGCLNLPADTAYDLEKDQLIVADAGNNRIQVLQLSSHGEFFSTNEMTFIQQIDDQDLSNPLAISVRTEQPNQFIYVADTGNNRVIKLQNGLFLPGASPEDTWEKFKDALRKEDIEKALTFITPFARDQYSKILQQMKPHLKEFVNSMGKLTPESIEAGSAHYELSHTDPNGDTFVFPVHFSLDEQGDWTISLF
jgi:hypothetical protein